MGLPITGISGLGTTVGSASYSFTVAANSNFVIVVNTTAGSTNSSVFSGTVSGFIDNTPGPGDCATIPPELTSVVSRMTHGTAGMFDLNLPLTGTRGVECRSGGANGNYTIVFTFANNLTSVNQATVTTGTGTVSSTVLGPNAGLNLGANQFEVNLTGVTNAQFVAVSLVNAKDATGAIGQDQQITATEAPNVVRFVLYGGGVVSGHKSANIGEAGKEFGGTS